MTHPQWTEELSIGLHSIDSQHKQLLAIAEALDTAIQSGQGQEAVKETFKKLEVYVNKHFAEEEDYMHSIGYPDTEKHITQHRQLLLRLQMLWTLNKRQKPIKPEGVAFFLDEWIVEHLSTSDKAIGDFARSRE